MTSEKALEKSTSKDKQTLTAIMPTGLPEWLAPSGGTPYFTPIDVTQDDGYHLAMRAAVLKDRRLIDMKGEVIKVKAWIASPYTGLDEESGEQVENAVRIGLVLDDNTIAVTYSFGVRQCLLLALGKYGSKVWDPPLEFVVATTKAKLGELLVLLPANDRTQVGKPGKAK